MKESNEELSEESNDGAGEAPKKDSDEVSHENLSPVPSDESSSLPEEQGAELDSEVEASPAGGDEAERAKQDLLYLRAEFDNYRKRMVRDQEQAVRFANEKLIKELMTAVDMFDRALEHSGSVKKDATPSVKTFVDGIEMTGKELKNLLARSGVEFLGAKGEKFDPAKHEAISEVESPGEESGKIIAVLNRGCLLHGRLLQPAKVVVSKQVN